MKLPVACCIPLLFVGKTARIHYSLYIHNQYAYLKASRYINSFSDTNLYRKAQMELTLIQSLTNME